MEFESLVITFGTEPHLVPSTKLGEMMDIVPSLKQEYPEVQSKLSRPTCGKSSPCVRTPQPRRAGIQDPGQHPCKRGPILNERLQHRPASSGLDHIDHGRDDEVMVTSDL